MQDIIHARFIGLEMLPKLWKLQLVDEYVLELYVEHPKSMSPLDAKSVERCKKKQSLLQHVGTYIFLTAVLYIRRKYDCTPRKTMNTFWQQRCRPHSLKHAEQSVLFTIK
jgi:hypothetical protein